MKVRPINIPIRYNKQTFTAEKEFDIQKEHLKGIENLVEVIDKGEDESMEDMTIPELKEYAEKNGIDLEGASKKADILQVIQSAENQS